MNGFGFNGSGNQGSNSSFGFDGSSSGQNGFGNNGFGGSNYGGNNFGSNNYSSNSFGGNNFGGGFGQNSYQQMPPKKPKKPWKIILTCVICAVLLLSAVINIAVINRNADNVYSTDYNPPVYTGPEYTFPHHTIPVPDYTVPEYTFKEYTFPEFTFNTADKTEPVPEYTQAPQSPQEPQNDSLFGTDADISYVMIYNPALYSEKKNFNSTLSTGNISSYVEAAVIRADGLDEVPEILPTDTSYAQFVFESFESSSDKAGSFITPYKKGQYRNFYYGDSAQTRRYGSFECRYAGTYCNIWTNDGSVSNNTVDSLGREFDTNIYSRVVNEFGKSRFAENGGKVNILIYNMNNPCLGGFFWCIDSYAQGEVSQADVQNWGFAGLNYDHDIINVNSQSIGNYEFICSTLAHEYQHCINFTNTIDGISDYMMSSWLNESMSGYIEEKIYPGIQLKNGRRDHLENSRRIRHGQSLYNFDNDMVATNLDVGVYGSVFYFSQYLDNLAGSDVFTKISKYHRNNYENPMNEAKLIAQSVPYSAYSKIDSLVDFNKSSIMWTYSEEEKWLSKLTLDYYISVLKYDYGTDPKAFADINVQNLLYDEINAASIEGGGRIIVALKDGSFEIPSNASSGLCYVAFDKNFNRVGNIAVK